MESERKACADHMEDMCSGVRSDCEETRAQLAKEIATTFQVSTYVCIQHNNVLYMLEHCHCMCMCVYGGGGPVW